VLDVCFEGIGNYNLDDRFINAIPDAWPGIQELRFESFRPAYCNVTFTAMVSFASKCRSLQSLDLTFDATQPTTVPQAEDGAEVLWPAQPTLRCLHVWHSQVSEVARMPQILFKVFPTLAIMSWCPFGGSFEIKNIWGPAMQEAREQLWTLRELANRDDDDSDSDMEWEEDSNDSDDSGDSGDSDVSMGGV
jgi:hypothetical protein